MESEKCFDKETEPLSNDCNDVTKCTGKKLLFDKHDFVVFEKGTYNKYSTQKTCLKRVFFGVVVICVICAFLFLLQKINKLESKTEGEQEQHSGGSDVHKTEALKGPLKDIFLLTNGTLIEERILGQIQNNAHVLPNITQEDKEDGHSDTDKAKELQDANEIPTRRHVFNIGMRQDTMMQDCFHSHMKHSFPDIDYAFFGYNMVRGYPLAHGHDPGFTFPIFHADYANGKQTADCRYSVPKGIIVVPDVSCVTSFTSDVIKTKDQLKRELSLSADVGVSGVGLAFSASAGFKQASSDLSEHESVYIISTATCNYYFSKLQKENPPPFTDVFVDWISKLNGSVSNSTYFDFIQTFGTHYPREILFGARYVYEHKMKRSTYDKKRASGLNIAAQASVSGLIRVSGGFGLSTQQFDEAAEFSKSVETKTITVGAAPPSNGDAMTWAASVQNNPVPAKYKLEPIENLFREEFMGDLDVDYSTISQKLKALKDLYYEKASNEDLYNELKELSDGRFTKMLSVENGGQYGQWFSPQFCPARTFAIGFNMKFELAKASVTDRTGLNGVNLWCANRQGIRVKKQKHVTSASGHRGNWTGDETCPRQNGVPHFLQSFAIMMEQPNTDDDTMANAVRFACRDFMKTQKSQIIEKRIPDMKGHFGEWSDSCPKGSAICGLQTRVEPHLPNGDNTALNDIRFFCCKLK